MSPANSPKDDVSTDRIYLLIEKIDHFSYALSVQNTLVIQQRIDQFFYMEKAAELRVLIGRIDDLRSNLRMLEERATECYRTISARLTDDENWLQKHCCMGERCD